jgi:hypothetical protein
VTFILSSPSFPSNQQQPNTKLQKKKHTKQTRKQCNNIIQKETILKYTNINPAPPNLHTTIKLHKPHTPIRPIINWKNVPMYELAKYKILVSGIKYLVNRLNIYPITKEAKEKELNNVKNTLHNKY